jgi:DNA transposition AAA+ family ATPase
MRAKFVRTENVKRFIAGMHALDQSGAGEACLMLADGDAGYGKSRTAQWYAESNNPPGVYIRLKSACTPHWLLHDLVSELGEAAPALTVEKLFKQVVASLCVKPRPLVIDEIEHAAKDIRVLETIRDISDACEVPTILMGRDYVRDKLKRHTAIWTRIASIVEFGPTGFDDCKLLVAELLTVEVDDAVINLIQVESEGRIREIVKALAKVERIGQRVKSRVTLDMVKGQTLCQEHLRQARPKRAA